MQQTPETKNTEATQEIEEIKYEAPAIVYEGTIGTRAGTPIPKEDLLDGE